MVLVQWKCENESIKLCSLLFNILDLSAYSSFLFHQKITKKFAFEMVWVMMAKAWFIQRENVGSFMESNHFVQNAEG